MMVDRDRKDVWCATSNLWQTPQRLNVIRVARYMTHGYVIHFTCAPNFGEAQVVQIGRFGRYDDLACEPLATSYSPLKTEVCVTAS